MHFSRVAITAFAALPSLVSAFTLGTISDPIGDVPSKCASQFNIPLMSCGLLPGKCSEACEEQLDNLSKTLKGVCSNVKDPQGLLLIALEGSLIKTLCTNGGSSSSSNSNGGDSQPSPVSSETGGITFLPGPGKTAEPNPANSELNFSGVVEVTSGAPVDAAPTGLVTDPSVPNDVKETSAPNYLPTTLETASNPSSTSASNSNNNNQGGLFTSQEDAGNSAGALRAGFLGLAVGFMAVIVNIA